MAGYDVYVVADVYGGRTDADHERALRRMENAGATTVTWAQLLSDIQRDWAADGARDARQIFIDHGGDFAMTIQYGDFLDE